MLSELKKVLVGNNDLESKEKEAEKFVKLRSEDLYRLFTDALKDII
jgi:hypothetical protein